MYKCESCGRTFDELEHYSESHGFEHPPFEEWDGCPYCGESGAAEVECCNSCHEAIKVDELYYGYCADCLKRLCTYDAAFDYLEASDLLGKFFCWHFNGGYEPDIFMHDLLDVFAEIYRRRKANDLLTNSTEWLDAVQDFILDADGDWGKDTFAKFLNETEG